MGTRHLYLEELESLNNDVIKMGSLLEESIEDVIHALTKTDGRLAKIIIDNDDKIDDLEKKIEQTCISLIAKQQPLATDLRRITSIMRIIADIERIADHCSDIAEYIVLLAQIKKVAMPDYLLAMIDQMKQMVIDTIDSFVTGNVIQADEVIKADDIVDDYFEKIKAELCAAMKHNPEAITQYVDYLMIVKYVERMADHSTNIAGWIKFIVTGDLTME